MTNRQHLGAILRGVHALDRATFGYAEHQRVDELAAALDTCRRVHAAIVAELRARGRDDLAGFPIPHQAPLRAKHLKA